MLRLSPRWTSGYPSSHVLRFEPKPVTQTISLNLSRGAPVCDDLAQVRCQRRGEKTSSRYRGGLIPIRSERLCLGLNRHLFATECPTDSIRRLCVRLLSGEGCSHSVDRRRVSPAPSRILDPVPGAHLSLGKTTSPVGLLRACQVRMLAYPVLVKKADRRKIFETAATLIHAT